MEGALINVRRAPQDSRLAHAQLALDYSAIKRRVQVLFCVYTEFYRLAGVLVVGPAGRYN